MNNHSDLPQWLKKMNKQTKPNKPNTHHHHPLQKKKNKKIVGRVNIICIIFLNFGHLVIKNPLIFIWISTGSQMRELHSHFSETHAGIMSNSRAPDLGSLLPCGGPWGILKRV